MKKLIPFQPAVFSFLVLADAKRNSAQLVLKFQVSDPEKCIQWPQAFSKQGSQVERADGLWNDTCFEMFLRPVGMKNYYEFNFSLAAKWNQYEFEDYRAPQPPKWSEKFQLESVAWDGHELIAELSGLRPEVHYEMSLTAVINEKSGQKHYLALNHAGAKPDFHLAESFILKI